MSRISFLQDMLFSVFDREDDAQPLRDGRSLRNLCESLMSSRGEVSGNRLSLAVLETFENSDEQVQLEFFHWLANDLDIDPADAIAAAAAYRESNSGVNWRRLQRSTESRRIELFKRINRVPGGTYRLVRLRQSLLPMLAQHAELKRVDADLQYLFSMWFNRGFLVLRQIDWHTPANILEKIIDYEAVHAINDWNDLRQRLLPSDRMCFAFFHPAMQDEPLIFVEVALTTERPDSIQNLLAGERELVTDSQASTAVFYSISNCQSGLRGVSFGNFLIKQVALELAAHYPNLKTFRTLSPVPSFVPWIKRSSAGQYKQVYQEAVKLAVSLSDGNLDHDNHPDMQLLCSLAAKYLVEVRRSDKQPMDPVARFHLGNGASLDAVIAAADLSFKGLAQSAGLMVSYLYDLDKVVSNHEEYAGEHKIAYSKSVARLLNNDKKALRGRLQIG